MAQEGFCTPAGCQTRCCRGCSRLALPRIFELAPFGHGFYSSHCITTQLLAVRSAGRATLSAGPSNRRLVGSGTPVRGAGPTDALFRWSFPFCPERPPATLCQPSGLAYATEFRGKCPNSSPLLLWRRGLGRGGRHTGRQPPPLYATALVPLSPRSAGGEREKFPVAMSKACYSKGQIPALRRDELHESLTSTSIRPKLGTRGARPSGLSVWATRPQEAPVLTRHRCSALVGITFGPIGRARHPFISATSQSPCGSNCHRAALSSQR
jgi:hypothetical protein